MSISNNPMNFTLRFFAWFTALLLLAGCGLKGPLYLPPPEPEEGQKPTPEATNKPKSVSMKNLQQTNQAGSPNAATPSPKPVGQSPSNQAQPPAQ